MTSVAASEETKKALEAAHLEGVLSDSAKFDAEVGLEDESIQDLAVQLSLEVEERPPVNQSPALSTEELSFTEQPVSIVEESGLAAMGQVAVSRGYLWVPLVPPGPQYRGRLGLYLEDSIETLLEERGALSPGIQASTGLDASLSDQLYRARLVEMHGIAVGIPTLEGIASVARTLDAEDSAVLRWWMAATNDRPVRLILSSANTKLRVYPSPVFFDSLFEVAPVPVTPMPPSPQMAESSETMDLSDLPPPVCELTNVLGTEVSSYEDIVAVEGNAGHQNGLALDDAQISILDPDAHQDVDLPELDLALGLSGAGLDHESPDHPSIAQSRCPMGEGQELSVDSVRQLALDYESPKAPQVAELACDVTPSSTVLELVDQEGSEEAEAPCEISVAAPECSDVLLEREVDEKLSTRQHGGDSIGIEESITDKAAFEASYEGANTLDSSASQLIEGTRQLAPEPVDLDEEEFLRTLEEDSSRAPEVNSTRARELDLVQPEPAEDDAATQPQEKSRRAAFIRIPSATEASKDRSSHPGEDALETSGHRSEVQMDEPGAADQKLSSSDEVASTNPPKAQSREGETVVLEESVETTPLLKLEVPIQKISEPDPQDPFNQLAAREWKSWVSNLVAARGPKPLSAIERMFVTDYTRLREAVRRGVAEPSATEILDEWQSSFSSSYSEAFDALRMRGKRPTMVLDLPELAARLGRLQGARRVQLLLVDGLRFDLGLMVQDKMRACAEAALTERLLLWSALPSLTSYQLDLLGTGPDGLKDQALAHQDEPPALVARGKAARVPRRIRTGKLELLKLDVVEDSLRQTDVPVVDRMDEIAADTATAIVEHMSKQPARTMVIVFGDHGFSLDPRAAGTTEEVRQGGASPEEVLVPAFAWLTGAVH